MKVTKHETPIPKPKVTVTYTLEEITEDEMQLIYSLLLTVDHASGKWNTLAGTMRGPCYSKRPFLITNPTYLKVLDK